MGSGFSACTESSVVRVIEISGLGHHDLNRSGGVHSDSCDSGISVSGEGNHRKVKTRRSVSALFTPDLDSEDEDAVTMMGTEDSQTPTPTPRPSSIPCTVPLIEEYGSRAYGSYVSDPARKHRHRMRPACKSLRHSSHPSPMLLDHAIDEEDEEDGGEGDDKGLGKAHNKPTRPRSAHQRRSRTHTPKSRTATATTVGRTGADSACESSDDVTSDDCGGGEEADSDFLSIPDETGSHRLRPDSFTAIMQRHKQHGRSVSNSSSFNSNDGTDWWPDEDGVSLKSRELTCRDPCWSRGSSFTLRCSSRLRADGRMSKKASERSISSILLTTAVELDPTVQTSGAAAATNPACFAVSNPEITQHILKCLQEIERDLRASTLTLCAKKRVTCKDYLRVVTSLRPRFLRLLGDFKMANGEVPRSLPSDCAEVVQLEQSLAQEILDVTRVSRGAVELSSLVRRHVQHLEDIVDQQATVPVHHVRPVRPLVMPANRRRRMPAFWDDSELEDDTDSADEEFEGSGTKRTEKGSASSWSREQTAVSHDNHVTSKAADSSSGVASIRPRAACRSARPASLASAMSSCRTGSRRGSACRPITGLSVLSGSKVHTVIENEDDTETAIVASSSSSSSNPRQNLTTTMASTIKTTTTTTTTTATSTPATSTASSRCSSRLGSNKSRPDSGIVVSSCSASSTSEATRETDADLAAQNEWISTSLEMLEQILQVRTEAHGTIKSLVKAITHGSTSDQLKAHALYRWLASQSLPYYAKCTSAKANSPTGKMRQLADGKITYASLYQELARMVGLKCEKVEGYAKGPDYRPGVSLTGSSHHSPHHTNTHTHSWNAVFLGGHYHFLDVRFGALPCKFFVEHFFMTPPDEMRLSHFPRDKRWLLMTQSLSVEDFEGTLKTWPTMFAFNIRPLNMKSVLRSYDGRLSITVLLRNVAVCPQLEYVGPGTPQDADALAFNIDQEIRNVDNAETFHLNLPEEGTYFFTLMVHDLEEDEDIPAFQYRVEYKDELL